MFWNNLKENVKLLIVNMAYLTLKKKKTKPSLILESEVKGHEIIFLKMALVQ